MISVFCLNLSAQETVSRKGEVESIIDSLARNRIVTKNGKERPDIMLTREQAVIYLNENYRSGNWADPVEWASLYITHHTLRSIRRSCILRLTISIRSIFHGKNSTNGTL